MQVTPYESITVFIPLAREKIDWVALEVENIPYYPIKVSWNKLNVYFNSSEHFFFFMKDATCVTIALTWNIQSSNSRHTQSVKSILGTFRTSSPSLQHARQLYLPFAFLCGEICVTTSVFYWPSCREPCNHCFNWGIEFAASWRPMDAQR